MIPAGIYPAVVAPVEIEGQSVSIQWGPATEKSEFSAVVAFEILSGPYAGQRISAFLYFNSDIKPGSKTGKSQMDRSLESLRTCGFVGDDIDTFIDQAPQNEVSITVEEEVYQGRKRSKVAWINKPGGGGYVMTNRLQGTALTKMSARLKSKLKSVPVYQGKAAERQPPTPMPAAAEGGWDGMDHGDPDPTAGHDVPPPGDEEAPF